MLWSASMGEMLNRGNNIYRHFHWNSCWISRHTNNIFSPSLKTATIIALITRLQLRNIHTFLYHWLTFMWWRCCGSCFWHNQLGLPTPFYSSVYFCLYGPFNCISFHKFSRQVSTISLCSSGLISALLVLSTIHLLKTVSQPWCNPLWLTGLKAPTNDLLGFLLISRRRHGIFRLSPMRPRPDVSTAQCVHDPLWPWPAASRG